MQGSRNSSVLGVHPGLHGGNAQMDPPRSCLARSQSRGRDRYANRLLRNNPASDMGGVNSDHPMSSGEAPSLAETQCFRQESGRIDGVLRTIKLVSCAHKKSSVN